MQQDAGGVELILTIPDFDSAARNSATLSSTSAAASTGAEIVVGLKSKDLSS